MGVNLFMHSARLVLGDWRNALKISGLLYLIYAIPSFLLNLFFPPPPQGQEPDVAAALAVAPAGLLVAILALVAFTWIAVAWHRYILLDEMPEGQFPPFDGRRLLIYFGYSLLIGIFGLIAAVVVGTIVGFIVVIIPPLAFLAALAALAAALLVGYRLAPVLPGLAVDRRLKLSDAWEATKGATGAIVVLAIVSAIAALLIDLPALLLAFAGPVGRFLGMIWTLGTDWVKMLVGVSILTTLYGHYVEGRAIPNAT